MEIAHRYKQLETLVRRYGDESALGFRCARPILARIDADDGAGVSYVDTTSKLYPNDNLIRLVHYAPGSNVPHLQDFKVLAATAKQPRKLQCDSYDLTADKKVRVERTTLPLKADGSVGEAQVKHFKWRPGYKPFPWKEFSKTAGFLALSPTAVGIGSLFIHAPGPALIGLLVGGVALSAGTILAKSARQHLPRKEMLEKLSHGAAWGGISTLVTLLNPLFGAALTAVGIGVGYALKRETLVDYGSTPYSGLARNPTDARRRWIAPPRHEWMGVKPAPAPASAARVEEYLVGV